MIIDSNLYFKQKESYLATKTRLDDVVKKNMESDKNIKILEMKLEQIKSELNKSNTKNSEFI